MTEQTDEGHRPEDDLITAMGDDAVGRVTARPLPHRVARIVEWARAAETRTTTQSMLPGTGGPALDLGSEPAGRAPEWGRSGTRFLDELEEFEEFEEFEELVDPVAADGPARRGSPAPDDDLPDDDLTDDLPDPEAWSRWLAQLMVEVVHGRRPAGQLARWTDERVLATVVLRTRQLGHGRARGRTSIAVRPEVRQVDGIGALRVQRPTAAAVEASAVIRGPRSSALAFRLEAQGDRWVCTDVDFGPQTPQPS